MTSARDIDAARAQQVGARFIAALGAFERSGELGPLVSQFADDAVLHRQTQSKAYRGKEGARQFWAEYADIFIAIESTFAHVFEFERAALLEWTSSGEMRGHGPVTYQGATVIETSTNGEIVGLRTYYDAAALKRDGV